LAAAVPSVFCPITDEKRQNRMKRPTFPSAEFQQRDILQQCSKRRENRMVPKFIEIVPELPKTTTGKIKQTGLS
jgi:acyl-coenzyme A synthetase/AMP-(fatty) acid ligase